MGRPLTLGYHLVNVFTRDGAALSGNPLCVFEDAGALDEGRQGRVDVCVGGWGRV